VSTEVPQAESEFGGEAGLDWIDSLRCPSCSGILRQFADLFELNEWGGSMTLKFLRFTILGGFVTTFARCSGDARRPAGRASVPRDVVPIVPRISDDEAHAARRAARELVPRLVVPFGAALGESD